jgi:peptidoglycan hydrolase-like protein with peptidoglycan-binding domain
MVNPSEAHQEVVMQILSIVKRGRTLSSIALALLAASTASAQSRIVLPAGTVIIVRTATPLQSATARTGDTFDTNVEEAVGVDEYTAIPAGSHIRGTVTLATPATRQQSGVIEVTFNRLTLPNGTSFPITGKLTSTDSAERRQIESDPNARVVLVGERGGIGAAIAGAGSGKSTNNIFAALGSLLSEGRDVSVPAGTPLAVQLERSVTLRGGGRLRAAEASTIYTAAERVRDAQEALARLNYYRGSINGQLDDATRRALFAFQIDRGLSGTGNLDGRTAQALGLDLSSGITGTALSPSQASAVRRDAQYLVSRQRSELAATSVGRLDPSRAYAQGDLDLWFALSAFADNASIYEQIVTNGSNRDAAVLAGRSLADAARRVETAMQSARASAQVQNAWAAVRRQIATLEASSGT